MTPVECGCHRTSISSIYFIMPTFYAQGVKANVVFFDAKPASKIAWTKKLWIYDFRTNVHMTLKTKRLIKSDFNEFIEL